MMDPVIFIPIITTITVLFATYFYLSFYYAMRSHLSRTIKLGPILRFPTLSITGGSLLIIIAFIFGPTSNTHHYIELLAMIIVLISTLSLHRNFKRISNNPLLIRLYLDNDLKEYDLITVIVEGSIPISPIIDNLASQASLYGKIIFLLGPQYNPIKKYDHKTIHVGIVTTSKPSSEINQYSPSEITIKLSELLNKYSKNKHIFFIGDFLDNLLESLDEKDFFKTWSIIHAKLKQKHVHGIFIIQKDIHNQRIIRLIEQFSDVSVELKEVENKHKISTYIKVTNYQDNIRTNWFKK